MAAPATQLFEARPRPGGGIRWWTVGLAVVATVVLAVAAAHVPVFIPSGADLRDPDEAIYAHNIWQESQTSLLVVALFLPWLIYPLLLRGARWGRAGILVVAVLGLLLGLWMTTHSLLLYAARPQYVSGLVTRIEGRQITLDRGSPRSFYLVVSDAELQAAQAWLHPGAAASLWVAPNGQAGFIGRSSGGRPLDQK
jgi:hypothetical protein